MRQELLCTMGQIEGLHDALTAAKKMDENWDTMFCFTVFLKWN
jgi:hypothetical protein